MTTQVMEERQEQTVAKTERLHGYVRKWFPEKAYGFIGVMGQKDASGAEKQWHFHINAVTFKHRTSIGMGVAVEFTPLSLPEHLAASKRPKACAIEVIG